MENKRALILLFASHVISSFAQGITMLSIPWYFASIVHQTALFGKVLAVATFVSIFWSLMAGTLIDRYPRRNIFWIASVIGFFVLGGTGLYGQMTGQMPIWAVSFVFVFTFFGFNIHYPNLYAFTQQLAVKGDYGKMNSIIEVLGQSTNVLAGALAAILLSGVGAEGLNLLGFRVFLPFEVQRWDIWDIFYLDAATYLVAAMLLPFITYDTSHDLKVDMEPMISRLKHGWQFLRTNRDLLVFGLATYSIFVVLLVEVQYMLPMYVDNHLQAGADVYASSEVYFAIGSLVAGLLIRKLTAGFRTANIIMVLMAVAGLLFVVVSASSSIWAFYIFSVLLGFSNAGTRITRITFLFNNVPNNIIGRANSIFFVYNIASRGLLLLLFSASFFSYSDNIVWAYAICGAFILVSLIPLGIVSKRMEPMKITTE